MTAIAQPKLPVGVFDNPASFRDAVQMPTLITTYVDQAQPMSAWPNSAGYACSTVADAAKQLGVAPASLTPLLGLPMAQQGQDGAAAFRYLASDDSTAMINGMFQACANAGFKGFYLRPGFEMSGGWFSWSVTPSNVADFNAAFAHIANLAHNFKGALIEVVWNPNVGNSAVSMRAQYPGGKYVDVIAVDTYGSPIDHDSAPLDAPGSATITLADAMALAVSEGKMFGVPETGSNNVTFVNNLATGLTSNSQAKIAFVAIWDSNAAAGGCQFEPGSDRAEAWKNLIARVEQQMTKQPIATPVAMTTSGGNVPLADDGGGQRLNTPTAQPPVIPEDPQVAVLEQQVLDLEAEVAAIGPPVSTQTPNRVLDTSASQAFINNVKAWAETAQADLAVTTAAATPLRQ